MKFLAFIVAAAIGFLVAFSFTSRDDIAAEVDKNLDENFVAQCVAQAGFPAELQERAPSICGCMEREFDMRGLKLTDAFGDKREEMQQVTGTCVQLYR